MTEPSKDFSDVEKIPEAEIRTRSRVSIVWIIPLVAALVGGWLAYKALTEKGPTVTITFQSAEGLEAGKTKVRYKDVEVGKVEAINLSEDLSTVVVTATLVKGAADYLNEGTRFWVVRARVGGGQVSGLGTLFSGAYIGIDPGEGKNSMRHFAGLEKPPPVAMDTPGKKFTLRAEKLGSLDIGSPVYFRQIKVGQVVGYELAPAGRAVNIEIFIHQPHDKRVYNNTRFWNAGGLSVALDARGVKVNTESLLALVIGGVAFETPENLEPGGTADEDTVFPLYPDYESIQEKTYTLKQYYVLYFDDSIRGLSIGAPVEFRGILIGEVVDISLEYAKESMAFRIPVLIAIEPERIAVDREVEKDHEELLERLIAKGLRAQLKTGNLLTGQLFVDLGFYPEAPLAQRHGKALGRYPEIPTMPAPLKEITDNLISTLNKIGKIPFEELSQGLARSIDDVGLSAKTVASDFREIKQDFESATAALKQTLEETRALAARLSQDSTPALTQTLTQAQRTLAAAEDVLSSDAPLYHNLQNTLNELSQAARAFRELADYLERHPDALLRGKGEN